MAIKEVIYTATVWESERGWGQSLDETREFDTEKERDDFIKEFNSKNNEPTTPDWYMFAQAGQTIIRDPKPKKKASKKA
jgi:hypothetical protein